MENENISFESPVGALDLVIGSAGLRILEFRDREGMPVRRTDRSRRAGTEAMSRDARSIVGRLRAYFDGEIDALEDVPVAPEGTPYQLRVWAALRKVPVGRTVSYRELAVRIGQPTGVRSVALCNARNPVAIVIPCHRVIGSNGTLVGYGGGLDRKQWLLEHEGALPRRLDGPWRTAAGGRRASTR
jgi:methylated-DNA-[protein]-cysteine S-methyltransferase